MCSVGYCIAITCFMQRAHQCQLKESEHHGHSLHSDGFICFFNLLCEIDESNCLVSCYNVNYLANIQCVYFSSCIAVENFWKVHWKISFFGNDSGRISKLFDRMPTREEYSYYMFIIYCITYTVGFCHNKIFSMIK